MQNLTQAQFQMAFEHGAVRSVEIQPLDAHFSVKFSTLKGDAVLVQARKTQPRLFGTVDSALKVLHKLGVRRIVLDHLEQWHPEQADPARRTRPDRAAALRRSAEYDRWVQGKVQASREDARQPISEIEWQKIRVEKQAARQVLPSA